MRLQTTSPSLRELDLRIVDCLRADPRMTNKAIAQALDAGEAAVAQRIRAMAETHTLRVVLQRDFSTVGFDQLCLAYIRVLGRPLNEVVSELSEIPNLNSTSITIGSNEIFVVIGARDWDELHHVIDTQIANIPGVVSVEEDICLNVLRYSTAFGSLDTMSRLNIERSTLDPLDEQIVAILTDDGRISNREVGRQLNLSEGTIRNRLNRLEEGGLVQLNAVTNPWQFGMTSSAIVRIKATPAAIASIGEKLLGAPPHELNFVARTSGAYDFAALIAGETDVRLQEVCDELIRCLVGVRRVETLKIVVTTKHNFSLVRIRPQP